MAPKDRRNHRVQGNEIAPITDALLPPAPEETPGKDGVEANPSSRSINILKELLPDSGPGEGFLCTPTAMGQVPLSFHLGGIPTPARSLASSACTVAPSVPPPVQPPLLPPACQVVHESWDATRTMLSPLCEPAFANYREKLRSGGRGALQRAFDAGLVPKYMKQDAAMHAQGAFQQQADGRVGTPMSSQVPYMANSGGHSAWSMSGVQGDEFWPIPMEQQQQMQTPFPQAQMQMPQMPCPQSMQQMQPQMPQQSQFQPSQLQVQQVQMPPMQTHLPQSGDVTPTQMDQCMAMTMGSLAHCDKDTLAAQLQATAECQCYED